MKVGGLARTNQLDQQCLHHLNQSDREARNAVNQVGSKPNCSGGETEDYWQYIFCPGRQFGNQIDRPVVQIEASEKSELGCYGPCGQSG